MPSLNPLKIYSRYDRPDVDGLVSTSPSMTDQSQKRDCDINYILDSVAAGNAAPLIGASERGQYYDATSVGDYQSAMDLMITIREDFSSLPSHIRAIFGHDLENYVTFMTNPANAEEAVTLGLIETVESMPVTQAADSAVHLPVGDVGSKATESDVADPT